MRSSRARCVITSLGAVLAGCSPFSAPAEQDAGGLDGGGIDASTDAGGVAMSCKTLLEQRPALKTKNGVYDLAATSGPAWQAYCDMTLDGGGWTLVGRSAPFAAAPAFGWRSATGNVTDLNQAYSLDMVEAKLAFDEVVVAIHANASPDVAERAYKFSVTREFISAHAADSVKTGNVQTLMGDCKPGSGGPTMLKNAGATSFTDGFFLRDLSGVNVHNGLKADGFNLVYQDCTQGGYLDKRQGLVLVR